MSPIQALVRRCTLQSALIAASTVLLPLMLVVAYSRLADFLSLHPNGYVTALAHNVPALVVLAAATTAFFALLSRRKVDGGNKHKRLRKAAGGRHTPVLLEAMQEDVNALATAAGLSAPPKVFFYGPDFRLASIAQSDKQKAASIYVSSAVINIRLNRQEMQGLFAHEIGHELLGTARWDEVMRLLEPFGLALLLVPVFDLTCSLTLPLIKSLGAAPALLIAMAALFLTGALLCAAQRMCEALLSRVHENTGDDISAALTLPGSVASVLLKREHYLLRYGLRSHGKIGWSMEGLRNLLRRPFASHPTLFQRIKRNRRPIA